MAFSIRNVFQKNEGQAELAMAGGAESPFTMYSTNQSTGSPAPSPFGPSIFKTRDDEPESGAPIGGWGNQGNNSGTPASPFSPFGASSASALTVGDLLPYLPPELVRANGAPAEQSISLSASVLDAVQASGQMNVSLFEIYRVCPALFQVPISPQDPRCVPLPQQKIGPFVNGAAPSASPFAAASPPAAAIGNANAFLPPPMAEMKSQSVPMGSVRPAGSLPPRRQPGAPPSLPMQNEAMPNAMPLNGESPFASASPQPQFTPSTNGSPFAQAAPASPFAQAAPNSPFAATNGSPFAPAASPFTASNGSPFAAVSGSPFAAANGAPAAPNPFTPASSAAPSPGFANGASPFAGAAFGAVENKPVSPPFMDSNSSEEADPEVGTPSSLLFGTKIQYQPTGGAPPASPSPLFGAASPAPISAPNPFSPAAPAPMASPMFGQTQAFSEAATKLPSASPSAVTPLAGFGSPFASQSPAAPATPVQLGASFEPMSRPSQPFAPTLGSLPSKPLSESANEEHRPLFPAFPGPLAGASAASPQPAATADEMVEIGLSTILKGQAPQDLGFDPNFVPAWITTKLPATDVRRQLPSGKIVFDLGQIIDGTEKSFRTVIAHGRRDYQVQIPINEVFHALPQLAGQAPAQQGAMGQQAPTFEATSRPMPQPPVYAAPEAPSPFAATPMKPMVGSGAPSPFASPFATPADAAQAPSPTPQPFQPNFKAAFDPFAPSVAPQPAAAAAASQANQSSVQQPIQPSLSPAFDPFAPSLSSPPPRAEAGSSFASFSPAPVNKPSEPPSFYAQPEQKSDAPQVSATAGEFLSSLPELPISPPERPASRSLLPPAVPPSASKSLFQTPSSFLADVPSTSLTDPSPQGFGSPLFAAKESHPAKPLDQAAIAPALPSERPSFPSISFGAESGNPDQMLLRALLGTSDSLSTERVVQLTSELPGVLACALVRGGQVTARGRSTPAVKEFESQAASLAQNLKPLAALIGIQGAETFSITTDERLITFSFQDAASLGILHEGRESQTGLRDKITLISREIARMA